MCSAGIRGKGTSRPSFSLASLAENSKVLYSSKFLKADENWHVLLILICAQYEVPLR